MQDDDLLMIFVMFLAKNRGRGRGRGKLLKPQRFLPPEIHGDLGLNCENTRTHGPVSIAHQNLHKQKGLYLYFLELFWALRKRNYLET